MKENYVKKAYDHTSACSILFLLYPVLLPLFFSGCGDGHVTTLTATSTVEITGQSHVDRKGEL
jgi:hypothetical protein